MVLLTPEPANSECVVQDEGETRGLVDRVVKRLITKPLTSVTNVQYYVTDDNHVNVNEKQTGMRS